MKQKFTIIFLILTISILSACNRLNKLDDNLTFPQAHDDNYIYYMPYTNNSAWPITQGYQSPPEYSHSAFALDIGTPTDTTILAAREGTVGDVKTGNGWKAGCYPEYGGVCYGNLVRIDHNDGSRAFYAHLNSVSVKIGDSVNRGMIIGKSGYSGNTCGATCAVPGPHLHFEVWPTPTASYYGTVKTKFKEVLDSGIYDPRYGPGYAKLWASYVSQNVICTTDCPPPPVTLTKEMIGKARASTALNFNLSDRVFNLFGTNQNDADQLWDIFAPNAFPGGGNAGYMVRRKGTDICLNVFRPNLVNGREPNPYQCSASDGDQQWEFLDKGVVNSQREWQIRLKGTVYCLNATTWNELDHVTMWTCDDHANQRWLIPVMDTVTYDPPSGFSTHCADEGQRCNFTGLYEVVYGAFSSFTAAKAFTNGVDCNNSIFGDPVSGVKKRCYSRQVTQAKWAIAPVSMTFNGTVSSTLPSQGFTVTNTGNATGTFASFSTDDSWLGASFASLTVNAGATTTGSVTVAQCKTPGISSGKITISSTGSSAVIDVVRNCTETPKPVWSVATTVLTLPLGEVGGGSTTGTFNISNTGNGAGTPNIQSSTSVITVSPDSNPISVGGSKTVTVTAPACTNTNPQTATITISGGGAANSAIVTVSRECKQVVTYPDWRVDGETNLTIDLSAGVVGSGLTASQVVSISNAGAGSGQFQITSSNPSLIGVTPSAGNLAGGGSTTVTISAVPCASAGTQSATLTVAGGNSLTSPSIQVTRECVAETGGDVPPATPASIVVTMSSNGRMFLSWPESDGATHYTFGATFDGNTIGVKGEAPSGGAAYGAAVANFVNDPDAADKQDKEVCFRVQAHNDAGASSFSDFSCTTYVFYDDEITIDPNLKNVPQLRLEDSQ